MHIAARYALFAGIATVVNLGSQYLVNLWLHGAWGLYVGIGVGTATGLVTKYLLDKRWIFRFQSRSRTHELRTFVLYGLFSVVTTLIFWGFELGFDAIFGGGIAKYIGAAIGLTIGYVAKYWLDKRFTFVGGREAAA